LDLSYNKLNGSIPTFFTKYQSQNLTDLLLSNNQFTGSIPFSIGNLIHLQRLELQNNQLTGRIPSSLGNLGNIQFLNLSFNQLSDSIPSSLDNFSPISNLNLSHNQLTGRIPSSLGNRTGLVVLDLSSNQLSGAIPAAVGNLTKLTNLYLSHNKLSGIIPSSLGNITGLNEMDLSNNQLRDTIPSSFGNLIYLRYLLLDSNRLSGSIPSSFSKLRTALHLNLVHNYFTFDAMEFIAQTFHPYEKYADQKNIPLHQNGNTLSVSAGGTLSNNTYKWLKDGILISTIIGDSVFHPTQSGKYSVKVKNSIAKQLTLYSTSLIYDATNNSVSVSAQDALLQNDKTNSFRVYPNPAKDILHIETNGNAAFSLIDQSGKILVTTNINGKGSINISSMTAGLYYLKNNSTQAVQKVVIAR